MLLLKFIFSQKKLDNPYQGGISAYALSLLFIAYLGYRKYLLEKKKPLLLIEFFDFYGNQFNAVTTFVNIGCWLLNIHQPFFSKNYFGCNSLYIMDPVGRVGSNVSSNCSLFLLIQKYFKSVTQNISAHKKSLQSMDIGRLRDHLSSNNMYLSSLNLGDLTFLNY